MTAIEKQLEELQQSVEYIKTQLGMKELLGICSGEYRGYDNEDYIWVIRFYDSSTMEELKDLRMRGEFTLVYALGATSEEIDACGGHEAFEEWYYTSIAWRPEGGDRPKRDCYIPDKTELTQYMKTKGYTLKCLLEV